MKSLLLSCVFILSGYCVLSKDQRVIDSATGLLATQKGDAVLDELEGLDNHDSQQRASIEQQLSRSACAISESSKTKRKSFDIAYEKDISSDR